MPYVEGELATINGVTGTVFEVQESADRLIVKLESENRVYTFVLVRKVQENALDGMRLG